MSFPWAEQYKPKHPVMRWMDDRLPLPRLVYNATGKGYPVPRNLNYFWNFGVLAGMALVIQIVTGGVPSMHYNSNPDTAFASVEPLSAEEPQLFLEVRRARRHGFGDPDRHRRRPCDAL